MAAKYYVTLTDHGAQLVAEAQDARTIQLSKMVIGDAHNIPYQPIDKTDLTQLVHQTAIIDIRELKIEGSTVVVSAIIPANIGGFNLHEIGLIDDTGKLVYIANYHGAYKPVISEGAGGELEIIIDIQATSGASAILEINPHIISADKAWVLEKINTLMEAIKNREDVKVGDLFLTTINFETSEAVATHKGFGEWERFGDGHALVTLASSDNLEAPDYMKTIGNIGGSYTHQLTTDELPSFKLKNGMLDDAEGNSSSHVYGYTKEDCPGLAVGRAETAGGTSSGWQGYTSSIGSDQAHNITQPSLTVAAWRRTA